MRPLNHAPHIRNFRLLVCGLLFCLGVAGALSAQPFPYRLKYLTTDDGLTQNTVDDILRDSRGYMWFATWNGLSRYNGYDFESFRANADYPHGLRDNAVHALAEDARGHLWIGSARGLAIFELSTARFLPVDDLAAVLRDADITALRVSDEGVWVGTKLAGAHLLSTSVDENTGRPALTLLRSVNLPGQAVQAIATTDRQDLLIGTTEGLWEVEAGGSAARRVALDETGRWTLTNVHAILAEGSDWWVGTTQGLLHFRDGLPVDAYLHEPGNPSSLAHNTVTTLSRDGDGALLVGTLGGLSFLDPLRHSFQSLDQRGVGNYGLNNPFVNSLLADSLGNVWIGTEKGGVNLYNIRQHRFRILTHDPGNPQGLSHGTVNAIHVDAQNLLIGTAGGGLNVQDRRSGAITTYVHRAEDPASLSSDYVTTILPDGTGNVWLGTWGAGLNRLRLDDQRVKRLEYSGAAGAGIAPPVFVSSLLLDPRGFILVGSEEGLSVLHPSSGEIEVFPADHPLAAIREVGCLTLDAHGDYWIGTRVGLFRFPATALGSDGRPSPDPQLAFFTTETGTGLPGNYILSLAVDHRDRLWVGTYGRGIAVASLEAGQSPSFTAYDESDGLANNVVYSVVTDLNGDVWLATDYGLSSFDPDRETFRNYYAADGLLDNQFYWSASHRGPDGALYFGTVEGLNYFQPGQLGEDPAPNRAVFTRLNILNHPVAAGEVFHGVVPLTSAISDAGTVELSHRDNVFTIEFSALDYFLPEQTRYAYRMLGVDQDWVVVPAERRFATYTNLGGGDYTFEVKASNGHGAWQETPSRLNFTIHPPFWATTWFRLLCAIGLVAAVVGYFRWRLNFLRRQTKTLERLVSVRTQEIEQQKEDLKVSNLALAQRQVEIAEQKSELEVKNLEISEQRDRMYGLNQKVRQINQLRVRFFTNISHEFRTPLTLIIDPLEELLEHFHEEGEVRRTLKVVNRNARRLLHLINQLMEFRKLEEGQDRLRVAPGDVEGFTAEVFQSFRDLAVHRGIHYNFVGSAIPGPVLFDREKLEHVLYNLLSNALKFTSPSGEVTLSLRVAEYSDKLSPAGPALEFTVRDTGCGIPAEELEHIFEHFYQASNREQNGIPGSGIGLGLVRELVTVMHGHVGVESEVGRGSLFTLTLPCRADQFPDTKPHPEEGQPKNRPLISPQALPNPVEGPEEQLSTATTATDRPLILVVEDNDDLRHLLSRRLGQHYRILLATDGAQGLEVARGQSPDLIISDIMMPGTDGISMCREIKTGLETSHIPVILLTAKAMADSWVEGYRTGADDYIPKPFNFRVLRARIDNLLRSRSQLRKLFGKLAAPVPESVTHSPVDQQFLADLYKVLEENYTDSDFTHDNLASALHMSRSLLYKKVKSLTDRSVTDFVNFFKLEKAAQRLLENSGTVGEVALVCGFADAKYFSRLFKKFFGMPPSQYINQNTRISPLSDSEMRSRLN